MTTFFLRPRGAIVVPGVARHPTRTETGQTRANGAREYTLCFHLCTLDGAMVLVATHLDRNVLSWRREAMPLTGGRCDSFGVRGDRYGGSAGEGAKGWQLDLDDAPLQADHHGVRA